MSQNVYMDVFCPKPPKVTISGGTLRFRFPDSDDSIGHQITFFASHDDDALTIREFIDDLKKQFAELEIPSHLE